MFLSAFNLFQAWAISFVFCIFVSLTLMVIGTLPFFRVPLTKKIVYQYSFGTVNLHTLLNSSSMNSELLEAVTTIVWPELTFIDISLNLLFTTEFILRFCTTPHRKYFFLDLVNASELVALIAFYIPVSLWLYHRDVYFANESTMKAVFTLYSLRVLRVFRLFRMARFVIGLQVMILTIKSSLKELALLLMIIAIGMVFFASFMYYAEYENVKSDFKNIPIGFWWSVVTMTSVGYGDMTPSGWLGYIVGSVCAIFGMVITGLPIPIISKNFNTYYSYAKKLHSTRHSKKAKE